MKKLMLTASVLLAVTFGHNLIAEGDAAAGKEKSAVCAGCHGVDGNSVNSEWPKLAGQSADYLYKQLQDYKKGEERINATMQAQVVNLSDEDMTDLAAYFASKQVKPGVAACICCHGPAGAGNPAAKFPALASQHAKYTATQLKAFRSMERANDAGKMMRNIALRLTDPEIEAVSQYIAGLQP